VLLSYSKQKDNYSIDKTTVEKALENIKPSGIKEILMEIPKLFWKDIGGYSDVKD
jgi:AAA family ATPase